MTNNLVVIILQKPVEYMMGRLQSILLLTFLASSQQQQQQQQQQPQDEAPLPAATQKLAWFTPILVQPLTHEAPTFASELAATAVAVYDAFLSQGKPGLRDIVCGESGRCGTGGLNAWRDFEEPHQFNDAFYRFQLSRGMADFHALPAFQRLRRYVLEAIGKMASQTGAQPTAAAGGGGGGGGGGGAGQSDGLGFGPDGLFCWASVHPAGSGSHHPAHTHAGAAFSAVFFASLPSSSPPSSSLAATAAPLVFRDPRGPLPPFDHSIVHRPSERDLVVFPSWLSHEVRPAIPHRTTTRQRVSVDSGGEPQEGSAAGHKKKEDDLRVSISCNARGDWAQTADLSVTFDA